MYVYIRCGVGTRVRLCIDYGCICTPVSSLTTSCSRDVGIFILYVCVHMFIYDVDICVTYIKATHMYL